MGEICAVCVQNESKETHANDPPKEQPAQTSQSAQSAPSASTPLPATRNALPGSSKKIDFAGFESDPELLRLLSRYPNLRIQLQSVYGLTLEPPPQEQRSFSFRGRGRGRGGFQQQSHWSQAKGDKEATESFRNMRTAEGDDKALAEFVQLLKMRFAPEADHAAT
ncbi:unnamed protein product [Aureobasidium vineae]|uniref:Uncharacterized protein n=1 Tax=Aureobasidium vineae TaxID=2773715 RepID=A0A9N8JB69_9PEZI|nr:unnamed protein product [Aureobasidium vineae]